MDPEIWVAVAAVFVSGGAIGTAGTLLTQWLVRGLRDPRVQDTPDTRELSHIRADLRALIRKVHNMDERLDFQEQLLGGGSPTRIPPRRLPENGGTGEEGAGSTDGAAAASSGQAPIDEAAGEPPDAGTGRG